MKITTFIMALILFVGLLLFAGNVLDFNGNKTQALSSDIPGKWTFSARPDMDEGFNTRPVIVWSIKTTKKTLTVSGIFIENLSNKKVSAVTIGWKLIDNAENSVVQQTGNTKLLRLEESLEHKSTKYLEGDFISFYDVYKPLLKKGKLEGDYSIKIFVSEVQFADKSLWKLGQNEKVEVISDGVTDSFMKASSETLYVIPAIVSGVCPKQECKYESGPPALYTCNGTQSDQYCTNCVTSCCNTICGSPPNQCQSCN